VLSGSETAQFPSSTGSAFLAAYFQDAPPRNAYRSAARPDAVQEPDAECVPEDRGLLIGPGCARDRNQEGQDRYEGQGTNKRRRDHGLADQGVTAS
jgi:hypothetical protein